jgi:intein-encoded DNA endonuclease-like protein
MPFGSVRKLDESPSPELAYVVGVAKGDATLDIHRWNYRIRLRVTDKDFAQTFNRCISKVLNTRPHSLMWIPSRLQWSVEVSSLLLYRTLVKPLSKLKAFVEHCEPCMGAFLRGFFDSEGSISGRSLTISNTRISVLYYAKRLLTKLGIASTGPSLRALGGRLVTIKGRQYVANRNDYSLRIRATSLGRFKEAVGFSIKRKSDRLTRALDSQARAVGSRSQGGQI